MHARSARMGRYAASLAVGVSGLLLSGCLAPTEPGQQPADDPTTPAASSSAADGGQPTLDWVEVGPVATTVVTSGDTNVTITDGFGTLTMAGAETKLPRPRGYTAQEALLDDDFAVVVHQHDGESEPSTATVVARADGRLLLVDGASEPATVNGGTWALGTDDAGDGVLFHATFGPGRTYCLAEHNLRTDAGRIVWCGSVGTGFNDARQTSAGLTVLSFTSGKPSCRTPLAIDVATGTATPVVGPEECAGWDSLLTDDGPVWSTVPNEKRIEEADFFATGDDGPIPLGTGDTGSLTWCAGAAYFTQQPQADGDPARLLRWDGTALATVYETPGSPGFLSEPRCGGSAITITARSEGGDEQVTANLR
ncbi:MAG: hypothetical protein WAW88_10915 [Nocardioides sp.]